MIHGTMKYILVKKSPSCYVCGYKLKASEESTSLTVLHSACEVRVRGESISDVSKCN